MYWCLCAFNSQSPIKIKNKTRNKVKIVFVAENEFGLWTKAMILNRPNDWIISKWMWIVFYSSSFFLKIFFLFLLWFDFFPGSMDMLLSFMILSNKNQVQKSSFIELICWSFHSIIYEARQITRKTLQNIKYFIYDSLRYESIMIIWKLVTVNCFENRNGA